jgi:hypothetical protein
MDSTLRLCLGHQGKTHSHQITGWSKALGSSISNPVGESAGPYFIIVAQSDLTFRLVAKEKLCSSRTVTCGHTDCTGTVNGSACKAGLAYGELTHDKKIETGP